MKQRSTRRDGIPIFLGILALGLALLGAGGAQAARIEIAPSFKVVTCTTAACDSVAVQVALLPGESGADSFQFELDVTNATLVGWSPGPVGSGAPGMSGGVDLQLDGTTLLGVFDSVPTSFDGPQTFDVAILDLVQSGSGTTELRFLSQEIGCSTCGTSGTVFTSGNTPNELLGVIVTPEPGTLGQLALGLAALCARPGRRNPR